MRGSDRAILLLLPLAAALVAVWILVISPKRAEEGELKDEVATLQAQVDEVEGQAAGAEMARKQFDENYSALVALGAAAPADNDQSTLVYTLAEIANENDLRFSGFTLSEMPMGAEAATAATSAPAPAPAEGDAAASAEDPGAATTEAAPATTAVPTEAAASTLPLGAAVGPAGLPISSYAFELRGHYFDAADFLAGVDKLVKASPAEGPRVNGRLLTIDGFSLSLDDLNDYPQITANLAVRTYAVPADQGIEAGATPAGPAPVDSTTTTSTPAPAASVTP